MRKHPLLWNKHGYQRFADIFVKNIFNPFPGTGGVVSPSGGKSSEVGVVQKCEDNMAISHVNHNPDSFYLLGKGRAKVIY